MSDKNQTAVAAVIAAPALPVCRVLDIPRPVLARGVGSEWSLGVVGGRTAAGYAPELSDRAVEATFGDLAGTTADKAGRRISTHNSTFRGRPRGRPV
jgi:hypothetical protein